MAYPDTVDSKNNQQALREGLGQSDQWAHGRDSYNHSLDNNYRRYGLLTGAWTAQSASAHDWD